MAEGAGLDHRDPPIRLVNGSWKGLTQKHGVVIRLIDYTENDDYLDAISQVVSQNNMLAAGRMTKRFVCFFSTLSDVEKVVSEGLEIRGEHVTVEHYSKPASKIVISNVPPCIPNDILRPIIARKGEIVGDIKPIPISSGRFKHIQSFRRSVSVILDRPNENMSDAIDIFFDGQTHQIYLSSNQPKCFNCFEFGHISKYCMHRGEQQRVNVQQHNVASSGTGPMRYSSVVARNSHMDSSNNVRLNATEMVKKSTQVTSDKQVINKIVKTTNTKNTKESNATCKTPQTKQCNPSTSDSTGRKIKKVTKRKANEPIVDVSSKVSTVEAEVRTLTPSRAAASSPKTPSTLPPRPTYHTPLMDVKSSTCPSTPLSESTHIVDALFWSTPQVLVKKNSPIPESVNQFNILSNKSQCNSNVSDTVVRSTPATASSTPGDHMVQVSPISFDLSDHDISQCISPLPCPLEFSPSVVELSDDDAMLTLNDLPENSKSVVLDMDESSFSLKDLNISIHQDITLTPPTDEDLLDFFAKLRGVHKQVKRCSELNLDTRYLIQRLIDLRRKDLVCEADQPRLKVLIQRLMLSTGLQLTK